MPTTLQTTAAIHHDWHKFGAKANDITSCNKQQEPRGSVARILRPQ